MEWWVKEFKSLYDCIYVKKQKWTVHYLEIHTFDEKIKKKKQENGKHRIQNSSYLLVGGEKAM